MSPTTRYAGYTDADLDGAIAWMRSQGGTPWMARLKHEGDWVKVDTRGMPPVVRQMVREQFDALELMTSEQVREMIAASLEKRVQLVDQVLTEAGR